MAKRKQRLFRNKDIAKYPNAKWLNTAIKSNKWGKERTVHLSYRKANGELVSRKVKPLGAKDQILIAHDYHRDGVRSFRLDRIQSMEKHAFWDGFERQAHAKGGYLDKCS